MKAGTFSGVPEFSISRRQKFGLLANCVQSPPGGVVEQVGQSTDVVADELDMTAATIRQARSRVLRRLREQLGDL